LFAKAGFGEGVTHMAKVATASYGVIPTTYPFPQAPAELARFPQADAEILRKLAQRSREIAGSAANAERKESWYRHNGLRPVRPMVLAEIQGCLPELAQAGHFSLRCANPFARAVEGALRKEQYEHEVLRDDHVVEPWLNLSWIARTTGHVDASEVHVHVADTDGSLSARTWDAPIKDIGRDFAKLRKRTYSVDREGTMSGYDHELVRRIASSVPTHSSTASGPMPSNSAPAAAMPSSPRSAMMSVAPNSRPSACRDAWRDISTMRSAPRRFEASTAQSPTAPSPITTTVLPGPTPPDRAAW